MNKFFDLKDINTTIDDDQEKKAALLSDKFMQHHELQIKNIKELSGNFPKAGEIFFLWSLNSFNAFTFIPYIIKSVGPIDELVVSTYNISKRIVDAFLKYLCKDQLNKVSILISDSIKHRTPAVCDYLLSIEEKYENFSVFFSWNHSKVTLMRVGENHFVVEGSGNFSENARHEQYIFLNNKKVYDFRSKWILNDI